MPRSPKRNTRDLPVFPTDVLAAVNAMDSGADPLTVARSALLHFALTRRPVPNYTLALHVDQYADVVCAALYRRAMLDLNQGAKP